MLCEVDDYHYMVPKRDRLRAVFLLVIAPADAEPDSENKNGPSARRRGESTKQCNSHPKGQCPVMLMGTRYTQHTRNQDAEQSGDAGPSKTKELGSKDWVSEGG
jgi:hypothetical protein